MCDKEDLNVFFGLGMEDRCPVCGDHVSGYHYGLQTCESCKGMFGNLHHIFFPMLLGLDEQLFYFKSHCLVVCYIVEDN